MKPLHVLFVASEMTPLAKAGGLGDVIGALPKTLKERGVDTWVIIPRYESIPIRGLRKVEMLDEETTLYKTSVGGVLVFLIDNNEWLSKGPIYNDRTALAHTVNEYARFTFFSKQVYACIEMGIITPDIVHAHDWHTGRLVTLLKEAPAKRRKKMPPRVVFTIHNLKNQGTSEGSNLLEEGIRNADIVTTVSPTYAKEILTKEYGEGLEGALQKRAKEKKLTGILNGIDYEFWNPARDSKITTRLTGETIDFKKANKESLTRALKLKQIDVPLFGLVARLTDQKGIDLIANILPDFLREQKLQFIFLGQGTHELESGLERLMREYPGLAIGKIGFDERLAHRIYAASDFFLMPSRFEPSGLGQMISMRYGTIPIVRNTGGLKDSVKDKMTGIVFESEEPVALRKAVERALHIYNSPSLFTAMRERAMKENFDFRVAVDAYRTLYEKLLSSPTPARKKKSGV